MEVIMIKKNAYFSKENKSPIKDPWPEPTQGRPKGKAKRCTAQKNG
jgi:hypothetical protein